MFERRAEGLRAAQKEGARDERRWEVGGKDDRHSAGDYAKLKGCIYVMVDCM